MRTGHFYNGFFGGKSFKFDVGHDQFEWSGIFIQIRRIPRVILHFISESLSLQTVINITRNDNTTATIQQFQIPSNSIYFS